MAVRLARAFTGKRRIVRFRGHFHGWNDHMSFGYASHLDGSPPPGVLPEVAGNVVLLPQGDVAAVSDLLGSDDDVACLILEPVGAFHGRVPLAPGQLKLLRELTAEHGVVLIFDEVVSGFRVSPGGAQALFGVTPDLTTLAKIVAGGFPGGAVVGRTEILDGLDFEVSERTGREKIHHPGTFNANPVSAAAGIAALETITAIDACEQADRSAAFLRAQLNETLEAEGVPWAAYGDFSAFHLFTNPKGRPIAPSSFDPLGCGFDELIRSPPGLVNSLRLAMLVNGADVGAWPGGVVSAVHSEKDIEITGAAFRKALGMLRADGEI
jgi:glutamate-1-semialdehyde 2,1-aminomutase